MKDFFARHLVAIIVFGVFFIALLVFDITCPIYFIFGVPCPTCGVTRAMLSLLHLDFSAYIEYNAMAFLLVIATILMFFRKMIRYKCLLYGFVMTVLVLNSVYYIFRLVK